jgi:hypothetical protein
MSRESWDVKIGNPKTQENLHPHPAFLQNRILAQAKSARSIKRFRILHGRLKQGRASPPGSTWYRGNSLRYAHEARGTFKRRAIANYALVCSGLAKASLAPHPPRGTSGALTKPRISSRPVDGRLLSVRQEMPTVEQLLRAQKRKCRHGQGQVGDLGS